MSCQNCGERKKKLWQLSCQKYRGEEKKECGLPKLEEKKKKKNYNNWVAENVREEKKKRKRIMAC